MPDTEDEDARPDRPDRPAIRPPLSFSQQPLWFFHQISPGNAAYHVPQIFELRGPVDAVRLRSALGVVVSRHEILRTAYRDADGVPFQDVLRPADPDLQVFDLSDLARSKRDEAATALLTDRIREEFDLAAGRVLRAFLIRLDKYEYIYGVVVHHIATDGWSRYLLAEEVSRAYRALSAGIDPGTVFMELPVQFADYAAWQRAWLSGPALENRLDHWQAALADLPTLRLRGARQRPRRPSFDAGCLLASVDGATAAALRSASRAARTSLFPTLAACFAIVLHGYCDQTDLAFGNTLASRIEPELEELIGCFANMVVLRVDVADDPPFRELVSRVNRANLAAIDHEAPFDTVVRRLAPKRVVGANPLFQAGLQLLDERSGPGRLDLPDVLAESREIHPGQQTLDLMLTFSESGADIRIKIEYSAELFDGHWADRFLADLRGVFDAAGNDPAARVSAIVDRAIDTAGADRRSPQRIPGGDDDDD